MSKVITFSQTFPSYHPKKGQPTYFVEAFYKSLFRSISIPKELNDTFNVEIFLNGLSKHHTIRNGSRFKKGEFFSPRVWGTDINPKSGRSGAYHSKQIILARDVEIKKIYDIEIFQNHEIHINGVWMANFGSENGSLIAKNDGLETLDFQNWFQKLPFKGQIICWNDSVSYC